jgi:serine/threonine protein kinase
VSRGGGVVLLAEDKKSKQRVAVKIMTVKPAQDTSEICAEIYIMKTCFHENIVRYFDSFLMESKLWMVMEYMEDGNLTEILESYSYGNRLNENQMKWIVWNVRSVLLPNPLLEAIVMEPFCAGFTRLGVHTRQAQNPQRHQIRQHPSEQRWSLC